MLNSSCNEMINAHPKLIFESLCDPEKARQWFAELYVTEMDIEIDIEKLKLDGIQYVARIDKTIPYSFIAGTMVSIHNTQDKLRFDWTLKSDKSVKNWTLLDSKLHEPMIILKHKWW